MKKTIIAAVAAVIGIAFTALAQIEVRQVSFPKDEIPATNPRVQRTADGSYTHIEVFAPFVEQADGSVNTYVADTAITMDAVSAAAWIKEAKTAVGFSEPKSYSKIRIEIELAKIGKYSALETWLASVEIAPGYTALKAWSSAVVIQDDFEGFYTYLEAVKKALGITDKQAEDILNKCIAK